MSKTPQNRSVTCKKINLQILRRDWWSRIRCRQTRRWTRYWWRVDAASSVSFQGRLGRRNPRQAPLRPPGHEKREWSATKTVPANERLTSQVRFTVTMFWTSSVARGTVLEWITKQNAYLLNKLLERGVHVNVLVLDRNGDPLPNFLDQPETEQCSGFNCATCASTPIPRTIFTIELGTVSINNTCPQRIRSRDQTVLL